MDPGLRVGGVAAFFSLCLRCSGVDTLAGTVRYFVGELQAAS